MLGARSLPCTLRSLPSRESPPRATSSGVADSSQAGQRARCACGRGGARAAHTPLPCVAAPMAARPSRPPPAVGVCSESISFFTLTSVHPRTAQNTSLTPVTSLSTVPGHRAALALSRGCRRSRSSRSSQTPTRGCTAGRPSASSASARCSRGGRRAHSSPTRCCSRRRRRDPGLRRRQWCRVGGDGRQCGVLVVAHGCLREACGRGVRPIVAGGI